ncbi:MAG: hypothetical protein WDN04_28525 [Rhodospirillales bacterium]
MDELQLTCIEPYPARLKSVLRPHDGARVEIVEQGVQAVGRERFVALERNDILFIDSTHVLKTGSDVYITRCSTSCRCCNPACWCISMIAGGRSNIPTSRSSRRTIRGTKPMRCGRC